MTPLPFLLIIISLMLVSVVSAESSYCTPPGNDVNVTYTHEGNWFNFTITSSTCYTCVDNGAGYGDVECTPCAAVPVVSFYSNVTCGIVPFDVKFTDTSSSSPIAWNWSFGDGNYSEDQNPIHSYVTDGVYSVNLSATNIIGTGYRNSTYYMTAKVVGELCPTMIGSFTNYVVQGNNGITWAAPFILAGAGIGIILFGFRRRGRND